MCGIAGWFSEKGSLESKRDIINSMSQTLCRRGPDEHGTYLDKNVCLMHRRLTVIDPATGKQPMSEQKNGKYATIVYNGELYNTEELRKELINCGFTFVGHSDTEVLLNSYLHWGEKCVDKLNGIFAFAIYDKSTGKLFMARDPIGVKPFFYYKDKENFLFASEIKTLLANPKIRPQIDETGLMELFFVGPGRTNGQGVFKNIEELMPGECAIYSNGTLSKKKYFKLKAAEHPHNKRQTIEYTRYLLTDAIERQLISDVPLCTFLSGGLDSSIISNVSANYFKKNKTEPLNTYSVNYTDNSKYFQRSLFQPNSDEDFIDIMVNHIGSTHHQVVIDNTDLYNALKEAVCAKDLPGMADVDSSLLLFCREVKKDFTVALSGECADELFGGYPWYHNEKILFEECFPWSRTLDIRRSILRKGFLPKGEEYVHERYMQTVRHTDTLPSDTPHQKRMREMFTLNFNWFMQTLLDRKDRCSMYSGLEVRVPFCDYRIVSYAYNMPWELKALNGREKGIVREAFSDLLPESIAWRKKSPYPKTHNPLYLKLTSEGALAVLEDKSSPLHSILNPDGVRAIIENPDGISSPWYGQLMRAPQILAYIIQVDHWFKEYNVVIV